MWQTSDGRIDRLVAFATVNGKPEPLGELAFQGAGHRRTSVFRYARSWLAAMGHSLDPAHMPARHAAFISPPDLELPLPFFDACPDGWGKSVIAAAFPDQHFGAAEYLAAAGDDRTGEVRFGHSPAGGPGRWIPPHPEAMPLPGGDSPLEDLLAASEAAEAGTAGAHHLMALFRHSADMGGARPKAALPWKGSHWIAKFRTLSDAFDDPRAEAVCLTLARACGIEVPDHEVIEVTGRSVLMIQRFDREPGGERLGYTSAATLMGVPPMTYATRLTYAEIATKARQHGVVPCDAELFRRMLFNCFVRNTDDHLRNHGFVRRGAEWRISPAFDLTLNRGTRLVLAPCPGFPPEPDPAAAFASYPAFGLDRREAIGLYEQMAAGMRTLHHALEMHGVTESDRALLLDRWEDVRSPPPLSELAPSKLVRPARSAGGDPAGRLAELEIAVNLDTHTAQKAGRAIVIRRKDTGRIDNTEGSPARVRDAWTTSPIMEYFNDGDRVPPENVSAAAKP